MRAARVFVARRIGTADKADLTIDHLTFALARADVERLAATLVRVLESWARDDARRLVPSANYLETRRWKMDGDDPTCRRRKTRA